MNRGKTPGNKPNSDSKLSENTQQFFPFWGFTNEFTNHFIALSNPVYTKEEVDELKEMYERIAHANATHVKTFLLAIDKFLLATNPQDYFKKLRDASIQNHETDPAAMLHNMAVALQQIKEISAQANNTEAEVLDAAFDYGANVIKHRMEKLKEIHDLIHETFSKPGNDLQAILKGSEKPRQPK